MRFYSAVLSKNIILHIQKLKRLRGAMCTHLCRKLQRKHDFAYTNTGASARGDVYAFMQKPSVKASFCVYRNRGVCRDIVYASMQKPSMKASFCVYRSWGICEGRCIRICAESCSENIILRIQKPARLRGELYTLLHRNPSAKASFCVYKY